MKAGKKAAAEVLAKLCKSLYCQFLMKKPGKNHIHYHACFSFKTLLERQLTLLILSFSSCTCKDRSCRAIDTKRELQIQDIIAHMSANDREFREGKGIKQLCTCFRNKDLFQNVVNNIIETNGILYRYKWYINIVVTLMRRSTTTLWLERCGGFNSDELWYSFARHPEGFRCNTQEHRVLIYPVGTSIKRTD